MLRFLQACLLPRAILSDLDAIYCARFVEKLHVAKVEMFQTVIFYDRVCSWLCLNYLFPSKFNLQ
jgi:THO complex subunit 2